MHTVRLSDFLPCLCFHSHRGNVMILLKYCMSIKFVLFLGFPVFPHYVIKKKTIYSFITFPSYLMKRSYQKRRRVERSDGDGIKDLGLLQGPELLFSVAQNLLQEGLLPGIKLQNLDSIQDFIHQPNATVHELHLNLLLTRHKIHHASAEPCISEYGFTTAVLSLYITEHVYFC